MSTAIFGGPGFEPREDQDRVSVHGKEGGHYNIFAARTGGSRAGGLKMLREWFPTGTEVDEMNFVLFSTSGVHGSYVTIEEIEASLTKYPNRFTEEGERPDDYRGDELTFLLVQPRIVGMTYGNLKVTLEDIPYLKTLREASWKAVQTIGAPDKT